MNKSIDQLKEKIELFRNNIKDYKGKNYDEYNTRADFIDTVFSSLGWDMYNEQGVIEQFREVIREDNVEIEGKKKKPDYSFKIGPQIVFYVEAKKPSVDIKNDPEPAYQLRRYAHTQGLKLSILTDFEEIAVYDTRIKPSPKDSSAIGRIFYCTYDKLFDNYSSEDYETNFDFLLNTFSKQAILNGSFDRYAEENKNKKGTASVDKGFLELLNKWREILAANIALKNENIDEYNLNIAVQKIIDRLVFLRIAEDRLIEEPNFLISKTKKENVYEHLLEIFIRADDKYNSGLFISEDWLKSINIDDNTFKVIIEEMYYPKCPYEFSVLPIEILGNAYEQFLGKTIKYIRKTKYGHKIEIEEKPEVRKAGGVYYTPSYIVNYIVENTVGKTIEGLTPEEIKNIKIVDPACGSGSFLIGAYNYLLRYNLEFHLKNETKKKSALKQGIIYQVGNEIFKLSTAEKSKILVNNIFGV
ncbi:MAG: N-6 DNA methylase, partial [Spirochaetota bacterium]